MEQLIDLSAWTIKMNILFVHEVNRLLSFNRKQTMQVQEEIQTPNPEGTDFLHGELYGDALWFKMA